MLPAAATKRRKGRATDQQHASFKLVLTISREKAKTRCTKGSEAAQKRAKNILLSFRLRLRKWNKCTTTDDSPTQTTTHHHRSLEVILTQNRCSLNAFSLKVKFSRCLIFSPTLRTLSSTFTLSNFPFPCPKSRKMSSHSPRQSVPLNWPG